MIKSLETRVAVCVLAVALAAGFGVGTKLGMARPMESDAFYFLHLSRNLAAGEGYVSRVTFWPETPSMRRLPAWPWLVSVALRLGGAGAPDATMRAMALGLHAADATLVALLTLALGGGALAALAAGGFMAVYPPAIHAAYSGLSEPLFLALVLGGLLALARGGRAGILGAGLLFGLGCLVRANFVLWVIIAATLAGAVMLVRRRLPSRGLALACAAAGALFMLPPLAWMTRNAAVCGRFPVLSTLRGQTFYGANNPVCAETLEYWGYWIFPDSVPGETTMRALAATMSEVEVDEYYFTKGMAHVRAHAMEMPRLLLGKLVRAYVPVPWKPGVAAYGVAALRWLLLAGFAIGLASAWRRTTTVMRTALVAAVLTNVATVLIFWGSARFALEIEPLLMPFFGMGVAAARGMKNAGTGTVQANQANVKECM